MPLRYRDNLPPQTIILPIQPEEPKDDTPPEDVPSLVSEVLEPHAPFCTQTNSFGVYRKYRHGLPTITPDEWFTLSSVSDSISIARDPVDSCSKSSWWSSFGSSCLTVIENATDNYFAPFLNASIFLLMSWFYDGSSIKSFADIDKLIHNVIQHKYFKTSDFGPTFSTARKAEWIDKE